LTRYRDLLEPFEAELNTLEPESHRLTELRILGYGEISTVFALSFGDGEQWACKRMPIFSSRQQAEDYLKLYDDYNRLLGEAGLNIPDSHGETVAGHGGIYVNYLLQKELPGQNVCSVLIHQLPTEGQVQLLGKLAVEASKIWRYSQGEGSYTLGLDGQISNWALKTGEADNAAEYFMDTAEPEFHFIDTSTPFIRDEGRERIDGRLLLKSAPGPLRPVLAALFLEDVIGRYYDFRLVLTDMIANLYKEQLPQLIDPVLERINSELTGDLQGMGVETIQRPEIDRYYREDKFIWNLYMTVRKLDRWIRTRWLGRRYEFILPGAVKR